MDIPIVGIEPVTVTVVGTGTGDGGSPLTDGTKGKTPDHQPDLVVRVITPITALAVRFVSFYLSTFMGSVILVLTPDGTAMLKSIGVVEFGAVLSVAAGAALVPALLDFGKNLVTIFGNLEKKYPLLTGNV